MAIVNRSFSVNVTPGMMPPIVHVSEYDVGRAYTVSILDEQGNTFTIPSGTSASIEGTLNGSVGFTQSATVSNNQVSFTLSQSMTAYSGKAWCKIKLTQNSQPIQTCAFILAVDRAGVEAETVIGAPGFQEQINEGVAEYFDNDPPFFELPSGGQSGQALLSDGADGAYWGEAGIPEAVKTALLACFQNVAWIDDDGQDYYDALYNALYSQSPSALHPLINGTHTFTNTGDTITITNGNHIRLDSASALSDVDGFLINISDITKNSASSSEANDNGSAINNLSTTWATIPSGANVEMKINNITKTRAELLDASRIDADARSLVVGGRLKGTSQGIGTSVGYATSRVDRMYSAFTASEAMDISCLFIYCAGVGSNKTVEFDLSIKVNGEKFV